MVHIFMMYNVKPGKMEEYRKHSRKTDQPTVKKAPGIRNFTVYEIKGAWNGKSPYQVVEDIEVDSFADFEKFAATETGKNLGKMWNEYCDERSQITVYGDPI
ncbi:MAG TPA: EthD family reductase [Nitrososphaerales archaeon]|nr:EthD family reductase [Nitrososphaerales archaeon]